jgi:prepilin-type N-terminal cleavage/methylation domain-containing protein
MSIASKKRRGVTLLELLVVITLLGIFTSVAAMRFGRTLFAEFGAHSTARQLSLALLTCQRAAIRTGDDHFLQFTVSGGEAVSYRFMQDTGSGSQLVDGPVAISDDVTVTVSDTDMRYTFEGAAGGAYQIQIVGENRSWQVDVIPITGAVQVTDTT